MNINNINNLIDRAHKNALEHGFYESEFDLIRSIMLIVSEIGEVVEADRKDRHAKASCANSYYDGEHSEKWFDRFVKDTFEDEIADIFIRIFDLMGHENIPFKQYDMVASRSMHNNLRMITLYIVQGNLSKALCKLMVFCDAMDLAIQPFILAKMKYNEGRPYLHGKRY